MTKKNVTEMYPTQNEWKSVAAERFSGTLKNKTFKFMTLIPKEAYIDKLDDIVNKYDNTYHTTIEMKTFDVTLTKKRMIMILNIKLTIM